MGRCMKIGSDGQTDQVGAARFRRTTLKGRAEKHLIQVNDRERSLATLKLDASRARPHFGLPLLFHR
jgi:hypothetical protein